MEAWRSLSTVSPGESLVAEMITSRSLQLRIDDEVLAIIHQSFLGRRFRAECAEGYYAIKWTGLLGSTLTVRDSVGARDLATHRGGLRGAQRLTFADGRSYELHRPSRSYEMYRLGMKPSTWAWTLVDHTPVVTFRHEPRWNHDPVAVEVGLPSGHEDRMPVLTLVGLALVLSEIRSSRAAP